jgi:hypothetical protein
LSELTEDGLELGITEGTVGDQHGADPAVEIPVLI